MAEEKEKTGKRSRKSVEKSVENSTKPVEKSKKVVEKPVEKSKPVGRDKAGRFVKGVSGNPQGMKPMSHDIKEMFKAATPGAIKMLVECCNNPEEKTADRIKAAEIILDRHLGKPRQEVGMDVNSIPQVVFLGMDDVPE